MLDKTLKIVSWNACGKFRDKFHLMSTFNADVYVIQECEDPSFCLVSQYQQFTENGFWIGENKNKGLGIFNKSTIPMSALPWENFGLRNFLPVRIDNSFDLLGVWACKPYIEEFFIYEKIHHSELNENSVIIGDFNSNVCWDNKHGKRNHSEVIKALKERGLESAYHQLRNEVPGQETESTFCLYRKPEKRYHIDYCFCNQSRVVDFKIYNDMNWLNYSDHFPIEATLKI